MKKILLISLFVSASFAVYNVGQTVSTSDQNVELYNCDTSSEAYDFCISFTSEDDCDQISECAWINNSSSSGSYCKSPSSLGAWNGATNGGDYHVIWIEMSASW